MVYGVEPDLTLTLQEASGKNVLLLPIGASDDGAHKQMMLQFSFKLKTKKVKNSNLIICSLHQKLLHNLAILNYFDMSRNIQSYHNFIRSKISAQRVSHFIFIFIFQILQHM